jgi:hypothetical protein
MVSIGRRNRIWLDNPYGEDGPSQWPAGKAGNFFPTKSEMCANAVLEGWLPDEPVISKETKILAIGSCFAHNIIAYLNKRKLSADPEVTGSKQAYLVECADGLVTTSTILQQLQWGLESKHFPAGLWYDENGKECRRDPEIQATTRKLLKRINFFIITLGLSEVWYEKKSGEVFWRSIPQHVFDTDKHGFRVLTVEENKQNIIQIVKLLRKHRPDAHVLMTLSPIPLIATFRPVSCVTANSVSKASLRVAIDEALREVEFDYWPSYELVTELCVDPWEHDRRHPREDVIQYIMELFEQKWCKPDAR